MQWTGCHQRTHTSWEDWEKLRKVNLEDNVDFDEVDIDMVMGQRGENNKSDVNGLNDQSVIRS